MCMLQCAIKMSECDYDYYYLNKCSRLKKKGLSSQNWCVSLEGKNMIFSRKNMICLPLLLYPLTIVCLRISLRGTSTTFWAIYGPVTSRVDLREAVRGVEYQVAFNNFP